MLTWLLIANNSSPAGINLSPNKNNRNDDLVVHVLLWSPGLLPPAGWRTCEMVLELLQKFKLVSFNEGKSLYSGPFSLVFTCKCVGWYIVAKMLVCLQRSYLVTGPSLLKAVSVGLVSSALILKCGKYQTLLWGVFTQASSRLNILLLCLYRN